MRDVSGYNIYKDSYTAQLYKKGMTFPYQLYVPIKCEKNSALQVEHDGENLANFSALLKLTKEGKAPCTICLGVTHGYLTMPDGSVRQMRLNSYDLFDKEYGDFLVYELIPFLTKKYNLSISKDPNMHLISGGSSGGLSALVIAWFHSDYFRKILISSPSFLAIGRGNEFPYLLRKYEPKPLRIYMERSEDEPNEFFGASYPIDLEAEKAFVFSGYDFMCKYYKGEGHCSQYWECSEEVALSRLSWLWDNRPISVNYSNRLKAVVLEDSKWEKCDNFPINKNITSIKGYDIAIRSADKQVAYVWKRGMDTIYSIVNGTNQKFTHVFLHTLPNVNSSVISMDIDVNDRLFVLTEAGIQCVRSYGLIDAILNLPTDDKPVDIAFDEDYLFVKMENGIYKRKMIAFGATDAKTERAFIHYYD